MGTCNAILVDALSIPSIIVNVIFSFNLLPSKSYSIRFFERKMLY